VVSTVRYFSFGSTRLSTGTLPTDKKFTGQRQDNTGLYYYGARYYDPEIGRFISADTIVSSPANPQSLNRYSYCLNNPLKYIDPSGHEYTEADQMQEYSYCCKIGYTGTYEEFCDIKGYPHGNSGGGEGNGGGSSNSNGKIGNIWEGIVDGAQAGYQERGPDPEIYSLSYLNAWWITNNFYAAILGWMSVGGVASTASRTLGVEVFAPAATGRVFWSGGSIAEKAAEAYAKQNGGSTLGMTQAGQGLTAATNGMDYTTQALPLWENASKEFAQSASGEVHVFQRALGVDCQSVWARVEYPTLLNNPNVTKIVYHIIQSDGSVVIVP
jgi:RHS repeat-associated protein